MQSSADDSLDKFDDAAAQRHATNFHKRLCKRHPSDVAMKSMTGLGETIMCFGSSLAGMSSSKKNATGTRWI
jgi:hypothetical protein